MTQAVYFTVVEQTNCHVYPETQQTVSSLPVPVSPTRSGSSSSVSPVQSPYSDMEYQPETPPASKQSSKYTVRFKTVSGLHR